MWYLNLLVVANWYGNLFYVILTLDVILLSPVNPNISLINSLSLCQRTRLPIFTVFHKVVNLTTP